MSALSIYMGMGLLINLKKAWRGIQVDDNNDRRTRYVLTLWSFFLITLMIISCFVASIMVGDQGLSLAFIDLIKHMMYVEGGVVSIYFGVESFFPSESRDYHGFGGWMREVPVDPKKDPPVHPSGGDAEVD